MRHGKFEAFFIYPDELDPEEDEGIRRDRLVRQYLGDKPIVYPPWEDEDGDFEL